MQRTTKNPDGISRLGFLIHTSQDSKKRNAQSKGIPLLL